MTACVRSLAVGALQQVLDCNLLLQINELFTPQQLKTWIADWKKPHIKIVSIEILFFKSIAISNNIYEKGKCYPEIKFI